MINPQPYPFYSGQKISTGAGEIAQGYKCLPGKCKVLSLIPGSTKKKKKEKKTEISMHIFDVIRQKLQNLSIKEICVSWAWWLVPVIPALGRLRQEDWCKFRPVWATKVSSRPA